MHTLQRIARHKATRVVAFGAVIKLAITVIAYALIVDMHHLSTAPL